MNQFKTQDMVVLHRNDPEDANYSISVASDRPDLPVYKTIDDLFYTYSENNGKWVLCTSIVSTTTGLKRITKETLNNIAKTTEIHREHNLSNELNDLCAEFGCLPGQNRIDWLRDHLRGTRKPETLYHYSASINTARGTVFYDGVITFPGRITGIEDYQQARAEIAKDGNVAPQQVNVHSLSIVS